MTGAPDDGVLSNLPRSRPGTRSVKRDQPRQQRAKRSASQPPPAAAARPGPRRALPSPEQFVPPPRAHSAPPPPGSQSPPDLVDLGVRAAEEWAGILLFWPRVAIHVTNAVIRRLPRLF